MSGVILRHVWDMPGVFFGHVSGMFRAFFGHVWGMFWTCFGQVWNMHWTCFGQDLCHIPDMFFAKVLLYYFRQPYFPIFSATLFTMLPINGALSFLVIARKDFLDPRKLSFCVQSLRGRAYIDPLSNIQAARVVDRESPRETRAAPSGKIGRPTRENIGKIDFPIFREFCDF